MADNLMAICAEMSQFGKVVQGRRLKIGVHAEKIKAEHAEPKSKWNKTYCEWVEMVAVPSEKRIGACKVVEDSGDGGNVEEPHRTLTVGPGMA